MDLFLIENCNNLIQEVENTVKMYGANDVMMDPGYCFFGACSQGYFNRWQNEMQKELASAWEFAITWDINEDEFTFNSEDEKTLFIIAYLASYMQEDQAA